MSGISEQPSVDPQAVALYLRVLGGDLGAAHVWFNQSVLERYREQTWFRLGDRDLATHIVRTARLKAGERLTEVCLGLQRGLGVAAKILPMTDDTVRTQVRTDDGWLEFQEYFVHRHQAPEVHEVRFDGAERAEATARVRGELGFAETIVIEKFETT